MNVLIADDERLSRQLLRDALAAQGYELLEVTDGAEALRVLEGYAPPPLAILDWMMPGLEGVEVCRRVRQRPDPVPPYLILLTSRERTEDIVAGLEAGADDYITKPFSREELRARVAVGARIVRLQRGLTERVRELEEALAHVKRLRGLLPICSYCKKVRNDRDYWQQVESYVAQHSEARFSHGICPDCYQNVVKPQLAQALGPPVPEDRALGSTES